MAFPITEICDMRKSV